MRCSGLLIPRRPRIAVTVPGAFLIGYAWGGDDSQFIVGPQVSLGLTVLFPAVRPELKLLTPKRRVDGWWYSLPTEASFTLDVLFSLSASLGSVYFPTLGTDTEVKNRLSYSVPSGYFGIQPGVTWWEGKEKKKLAIILGLATGMLLNVDQLGPAAYYLGFQPGILAEF